MRPDVAGHDVDLVLLDQALGRLLALLRIELVVGVDHFEVDRAGLAAQMFDGQLDGVAHVVADHRRWGRQRRDKSDLDLGRLGRGQGDQQGGGACGQYAMEHMKPPLYQETTLMAGCDFRPLLWTRSRPGRSSQLGFSMTDYSKRSRPAKRQSDPDRRGPLHHRTRPSGLVRLAARAPRRPGDPAPPPRRLGVACSVRLTASQPICRKIPADRGNRGLEALDRAGPLGPPVSGSVSGVTRPTRKTTKWRPSTPAARWRK